MPNVFPEIKNGFNFECTLCGDCCVGDQEVLLNWYDLYNMAQFLSYEHTGQLFTEQWIELVQDETQNVWRPKIRFKEKPFKFCPFLTNELDERNELKGYCQMHPYHKPLVCALAPVGCRYDAQTHNTQFILVPPTEDCPGMNRPKFNLLSDYLTGFEKALHFQAVFFEALERLKHHRLSAAQFREHLYSFGVASSFERILATLIENLNHRFQINLTVEIPAERV